MDQDRRIVRHRRIRVNLRGSAGRPRASVFRSLKRTSVQLIDDEAGSTLLAVNQASKRGEKKIEQARRIGQLVAKKAKESGIHRIVFDRGGYKYHGRVQAVAEGMREGGLEF